MVQQPKGRNDHLQHEVTDQVFAIRQNAVFTLGRDEQRLAIRGRKGDVLSEYVAGANADFMDSISRRFLELSAAQLVDPTTSPLRSKPTLRGSSRPSVTATLKDGTGRFRCL